MTDPSQAPTRADTEQDPRSRIDRLCDLSTIDPDKSLAVLHRFGDLYLLEKDLERELKKVKASRGKLEGRAEQQLLESGQSRANLDTGVTVFPESKLWVGAIKDDDADKATPEQKAAAIKALRDMGLGHYVEEGFNTNSVSAHFRAELARLEAERREEAEAAGQDPDLVEVEPDEILPPEARDALRVSVDRKMKATRAG